MAQKVIAPRDDNNVPALVGASSEDPTVAILPHVNPSNHALKTDQATGLNKTNDAVTTYEAGCNATTVDLSIDADVVVTPSPAYLIGYTVDTVMSAHAALIKDNATTKFTVPASSAAGFDRDTRVSTFSTNITVESNDAATGKIIIFWRPI